MKEWGEDEEAKSCSSLQATNTARVWVSIPLKLHGLLWMFKKKKGNKSVHWRAHGSGKGGKREGKVGKTKRNKWNEVLSNRRGWIIGTRGGERNSRIWPYYLRSFHGDRRWDKEERKRMKMRENKGGRKERDTLKILRGGGWETYERYARWMYEWREGHLGVN